MYLCNMVEILRWDNPLGAHAQNDNYMQDSMLTMDFMTLVLASRDNL